MPDRDTIVFIPAWNEEHNLRAVLDELRASLPDVDLLVIDDGSTDRPRTGARRRRARPLVRREPRPAAGIAAGYGEAAADGYAYCGRVDADGQHPAHELVRLLELVRSGGCDAAIGSRFAEGHAYDEDRYEPSPRAGSGSVSFRRRCTCGSAARSTIRPPGWRL